MRRDWKVIREILVGLEDESLRRETVDASPVLCGHIEIMRDRNLVRGFMLTNEGHDFIAVLRDEARLDRALKRIEEAGIGPAEDILMEVIVSVGKDGDRHASSPQQEPCQTEGAGVVDFLPTAPR